MYKLLKTQIVNVRQTLDRLEAILDRRPEKPGTKYQAGKGDHIASAQLGSIQQKLGTLLLREDFGYHAAEVTEKQANTRRLVE